MYYRRRERERERDLRVERRALRAVDLLRDRRGVRKTRMRGAAAVANGSYPVNVEALWDG
jgi:hypothetical protein